MRHHIIVAILTGILLLPATAMATVPYYMTGDKGDDVLEIQNRLKSQGVLADKPDGQYGDKTAVAVKTFQRKQKLKVTGAVDLLTYKALLGKDYKDYNAKDKIDEIMTEAMKYQTVKYIFGGATPKGFDCSGFVQFVFKNNDIKLPRTADIQFAQAGQPVDIKKLKPGDLVFFQTYEKGASHVGIYIGNGKFIHASSTKGVTVSRLSDDYYKARFWGAKRIIGTVPVGDRPDASKVSGKSILASNGKNK